MKKVEKDILMSDLIYKHLRGALNGNEGEILEAWLQKPENMKFFIELKNSDRLYQDVRKLKYTDEQPAWLQMKAKMSEIRRRKWLRRFYVVAALVVVGLGCGWLLFDKAKEIEPILQILPNSTKAILVLNNGSQIDLTKKDLTEIVEEGVCVKNDTLSGLHYLADNLDTEKSISHTIKVPVAGEYHFILSDGTKVWMNSDSEITFPVSFAGNGCRNVYLKGEAYFEVKSDVAHPFIVHVGEVDIRVLGTKFNVSAYRNTQEVVTTLVNGKVKVITEDQEIELDPNFQAIVNTANKSIEKRKVESGMYVAWLDGIFKYEDMTLSEITEQLSRWYGVDFIFSAERLKKRCFTGIVRKYDMLDEVLHAMEKTTNICFVINGRTIAVQEVMD